MFGFFGNKGETEEIRFDDVIGALEELDNGTEIDMSYRSGRKKENHRQISPEQAKDLVRNKISPERDFSLGERYDGVTSLAGAVTTPEGLPEGLYTDVLHTVTESGETVYHTLEIAQGFLYRGQHHEDSFKGKVLRQAELSYELPLDQD